MRDHFSSKTPRLDFEAVLEIPQYLASGTEFQFRASFHVICKTDNVAHVPPTKFIILKFELLDDTFIRAPRDWEASSMMSCYHRSDEDDNMPPSSAPFSSQEHRGFNERKVNLNSIPKSLTLKLDEVPAYGDKMKREQAKSCDTWLIARVPGHQPSEIL